MITLTEDQLQKLLYRASTDAVEKYRAEYRDGNNATWISHAQFYKGLNDEARRMASNAKCAPIDLDAVAAAI